MTKKIHIITGASNNHAKSILQFLCNAKEYSKGSNIIFHVFNFGLNQDTIIEIKKIISNVNIYFFDFTKYPSYFNIAFNKGEYAWKPTAIYEISKKVNGIILWCDSGNLFTKHIDEIANFIESQDFYSPISSGTMTQWTHQSTINWFVKNYNIDGYLLEQIINLKNRSGGIIGFNNTNKIAQKIIEEWAYLASVKECIAPTGSNRKNHRQDQAVLSFLCNMYICLYNIKMKDYKYGILTHNDIG